MKRNCLRKFAELALLTALFLIATRAPAPAWDSRTHELIARLAIDALPPGPQRTLFEQNAMQLQQLAIAPDTVLRPLYGQAEGRRHYIDLEDFGADPFARLVPDEAAMQSQVGAELLQRSGILPWAIEDEASQAAAAWRRGDCEEALRHAGYLAHYIGDASQPLHTTRFYDGPDPSDRGMHARIEAAVDHEVRALEDASAGKIHPQPIASVWNAVIPELQRAHALVPEMFSADRAVHATTDDDRRAYTAAFFEREQATLVRQIDDAATVLVSVWTYEWQAADAAARCAPKSTF